MRSLCTLTVFFVASFAWGSSGTAQPAAAHMEIVLADGTTERATVPTTALHRSATEVSSAGCRSCVGHHVSYDVSVRPDHGHVESVSLDVDYVGGERARVTIGNGPYPARSSVRVRMRGASEEVELTGSLTQTTEAGELVFVVHASGPRSPVRTITLRFPRPA